MGGSGECEPDGHRWSWAAVHRGGLCRSLSKPLFEGDRPVRRSLLGVLMALGLLLGVVAAAPANAASKSLPSLVTASNIRKHQKALQQIADANGGNRAVGSPGYEISVKYVKDQLKRA